MEIKTIFIFLQFQINFFVQLCLKISSIFLSSKTGSRIGKGFSIFKHFND